jgi:GNAT superfamily N-acetyltransferase
MNLKKVSYIKKFLTISSQKEVYVVKIYELQADSPDIIKRSIADLLSQQRTRTEDKAAYDALVNGINLAASSKLNSRLLIAEKENEVVGIAFYNVGISLNHGGPYIWLNELFVHEEWRNRGIARKLLLHIIYWAEKEGLKSIELETGINNSVTKHLYNSLGFHEIISKRYRFTF